MNRVERLLILVPWLRAHQGSTIEETAAHFDISIEQVVQDVLLLSVTGFGQFFGEQFSVMLEDNRIFVDDTLGLDRPVKFDTSEAASLLLGLEALANLPDADIDAIDTAREKLSSVLPLQLNLSIVQSERSNIHEVLKLALSKKKQVKFEYWNTGRDDLTTRIASPLKLYFVDGMLFLDAYCHTSDDWRTFDLSRILSPTILQEDIATPQGGFREMLLTSLSIEVSKSDAVELEKFNVIEKQDVGDSIKATISVFGQDLLVRRLIASGGKVKVSQEIADKVRERAQSGLDAYGSK